jgi:hypothetical protein
MALAFPPRRISTDDDDDDEVVPTFNFKTNCMITELNVEKVVAGTGI